MTAIPALSPPCPSHTSYIFLLWLPCSAGAITPFPGGHWQSKWGVQCSQPHGKYGQVEAPARCPLAPHPEAEPTCIPQDL